MPRVLNQVLQNFWPGGRPDQIHAGVPLDQKTKVDAKQGGLFIAKGATQPCGSRRDLGRIER